LICVGARRGAEGGAAARRGRFFEKKLRKKLFYGKSFYWSMLMVRTWGHSFLWDGAPSICRGQRPFFRGPFFCGPIFLWVRLVTESLITRAWGESIPPRIWGWFFGGSLYLFCSESRKLGFIGEFRQRYFAKNQPQTGRGEPWPSRKQRIRFFIGRGMHIVRLPPRGSCRANARLREPAQR